MLLQGWLGKKTFTSLMCVAYPKLPSDRASSKPPGSDKSQMLHVCPNITESGDLSQRTSNLWNYFVGWPPPQSSSINQSVENPFHPSLSSTHQFVDVFGLLRREQKDQALTSRKLAETAGFNTGTWHPSFLNPSLNLFERLLVRTFILKSADFFTMFKMSEHWSPTKKNIPSYRISAGAMIKSPDPRLPSEGATHARGGYFDEVCSLLLWHAMTCPHRSAW